MEKRSLLFVAIFIAVLCLDVNASRAAQETIRITCWEGYADAAIVKEFKDLVKEEVQDRRRS